MQCTEAALKQGSSQVSLAHTSSHKNQDQATVSHDTGMACNTAESVVPSMEFLRSKESLQNEVERCLADLKNYMKQQPKVGLSHKGVALGR